MGEVSSVSSLAAAVRVRRLPWRPRSSGLCGTGRHVLAPKWATGDGVSVGARAHCAWWWGGGSGGGEMGGRGEDVRVCQGRESVCDVMGWRVWWTGEMCAMVEGVAVRHSLDTHAPTHLERLLSCKLRFCNTACVCAAAERPPSAACVGLRVCGCAPRALLAKLGHTPVRSRAGCREHTGYADSGGGHMLLQLALICLLTTLLRFSGFGSQSSRRASTLQATQANPPCGYLGRYLAHTWAVCWGSQSALSSQVASRIRVKFQHASRRSRRCRKMERDYWKTVSHASWPHGPCYIATADYAGKGVTQLVNQCICPQVLTPRCP